MHKTPRILLALVAGAYLVAGPALAPLSHAGDHLKCYKVKDLRSQTDIHYNFTLTPDDPPFNTESGCRAQSAARMICIDVTKSAVTPPPFPALPGAQIGNLLLCYNARCPREENATVSVNDQLGGNGQVLVKRRTAKRIVCTPVGTPPATTSTTSSTILPPTTITTTSTSSTTSTTAGSASPSFVFIDASGLF